MIIANPDLFQNYIIQTDKNKIKEFKRKKDEYKKKEKKMK
jgi:hypothetical protein